MGCERATARSPRVRNGFELGGVVDAEAAGDLPRRAADGRGADEEADASVNREDRAAIVEAGDGVDVRAGAGARAADGADV